MTEARTWLIPVAAGAFALAGCATTTEVRPDMLPAITGAGWGGGRIQGLVADPRGKPVELDGFLEGLAITRPHPRGGLGAETSGDIAPDVFEAPVASAISGRQLGIQDAKRRLFYAPSDVARAEVTTSNPYPAYRATGLTLAALGVLSIGVAAFANVALRNDADPTADGRRQAVALPLIFGGLGLLGVGIPFAVKGYGEPAATPILLDAPR